MTDARHGTTHLATTAKRIGYRADIGSVRSNVYELRPRFANRLQARVFRIEEPIDVLSLDFGDCLFGPLQNRSVDEMGYDNVYDGHGMIPHGGLEYLVLLVDELGMSMQVEERL